MIEDQARERNQRGFSAQSRLSSDALGLRCVPEPVRLYEDRHPWPIKCPDCSSEFVEQIGRLRSKSLVRCPSPDCQSFVDMGPRFRTALRDAKAGAYNPFTDVWTLASRPRLRQAFRE